MMGTVADSAVSASKIGLSVLPIVRETKKSKVSWTKYQNEIATEAEIRSIFADGDWLAIPCGKGSGNLEAVDFDAKELYPEWRKLMEEYNPDLLERLVVQSTPRKGFHVLYRCESIEGNLKLANQEDGSVAIETRGQGGYILASPTPGYKIVQNSYKRIPTITPDERDLILALCRSLGFKPVESYHYESNPGQTPGVAKPGEDYGKRTRWEDILEPLGWTRGRTTGGRTGWARPGKSLREGIGATTGNGENDLLYVHTSNAPPFAPGCSYSKFGAYTVVNHGGDFFRAAQTLKSQGFGSDFQKQRQTQLAQSREPVVAKGLTLTKFTKEQFAYVQPSYLVEPYLPTGKCVLLDADGGTGKSCLCAAWAASLTSGRHPLTGYDREPINVLYLHRGEDTDAEITTVFAANGGDFDRWFLFSDQTLQFDSQGLADLELTIAENNIQLIVVDALFYFLSTLMQDTYNALPAMAVMERLNGIAERTSSTFWNIRHTKKGNPDTKASDLGMGSVQFRNSHRGQLMLRFHPDEEGVIVCTDEKGSLLVRKGKPFCYRREELEIMYLPNIPNPFGQKKQKSKTADCEEWLRAQLDFGPWLATALIERAKEFEFKESLTYEAASALGVAKGYQPAVGHRGPAWWAKPGYNWSRHEWGDPFEEA
jgi:hypothetical protein